MTTAGDPPMIATPQFRKARFGVTFPDDDDCDGGTPHYCASVDSLTKLLQDRNRPITKWQVYSLVSPNDRRFPYRKSKALLLGAIITRIDRPRQQPTPCLEHSR
jgi:hypothetical protein